jgi:hypothetical protein
VDFPTGTVVNQFTEHDAIRGAAILAALLADVKHARTDQVEFRLNDLTEAKAELA